jgi:cytochrome c biogenesis protein CcdA
MQEFLYNLYDSARLPLVSALVLGLMTAISPCPMATNITAIGFISKDIEDRKRVFLNGIIYTLGRAVTYTVIGLIFYFSADQLGFFETVLLKWGEKIVGPLLVLIGIFMLDIIRINFPGMGKLSERMEQKSRSGFWGVLLLGIVFALAFCPYSGVLYFGALIPLTMSSPGGLYLPIIFAIATGIPVIIFAWFLAFSIGKVGTMYNKVKTFEKWFRKVIAVVFILAGLWLSYLTWFGG